MVVVVAGVFVEEIHDYDDDGDTVLVIMLSAWIGARSCCCLVTLRSTSPQWQRSLQSV